LRLKKTSDFPPKCVFPFFALMISKNQVTVKSGGLKLGSSQDEGERIYVGLGLNERKGWMRDSMRVQMNVRFRA